MIKRLKIDTNNEINNISILILVEVPKKINFSNIINTVKSAIVAISSNKECSTNKLIDLIFL